MYVAALHASVQHVIDGTKDCSENVVDGQDLKALVNMRSSGRSGSREQYRRSIYEGILKICICADELLT
jgi:hypothetical protein